MTNDVSNYVTGHVTREGQVPFSDDIKYYRKRVSWLSLMIR